MYYILVIAENTLAFLETLHKPQTAMTTVTPHTLVTHTIIIYLLRNPFWHLTLLFVCNVS